VDIAFVLAVVVALFLPPPLNVFMVLALFSLLYLEGKVRDDR